MGKVPRRVLLAITSAKAPLYPDGGQTGLFVTEALHPFQIFREAGFEVDLVSETGSYSPDALSLTKDWISEKDLAIFEDHSSEFRSKLDKLYKPSDLKADNYGLFFASAGHASLIDYPDARGLQALGVHIWNAGGIVSAVCHGGAIVSSIVAVVESPLEYRLTFEMAVPWHA